MPGPRSHGACQETVNSRALAVKWPDQVCISIVMAAVGFRVD